MKTTVTTTPTWRACGEAGGGLPERGEWSEGGTAPIESSKGLPSLNQSVHRAEESTRALPLPLACVRKQLGPDPLGAKNNRVTSRLGSVPAS